MNIMNNIGAHPSTVAALKKSPVFGASVAPVLARKPTVMSAGMKLQYNN